MIPAKVHLPCYIVIIAGFVTIVQMVMHAYMDSLYNALGVFLPLIVVNCIILGRAEMFACKNNVVDCVDGIGMGIGYTLTVVLMAIIRESWAAAPGWASCPAGQHGQPIGIMTQAPGGFFCFGCLMALVTVSRRKAIKMKDRVPASHRSAAADTREKEANK